MMHIPHAGGRARAPQGSSPTILLDIMDTVVKDPFFEVMPAFFGLTFKELLDSKHPTAWVEFELGQITEAELFAKFFKDGRPIDQKAFLDVVIEAYEYLDGMEDVLRRLSDAGHDVHSFSNYPSWHEYIEKKLQLSRYLEWTFVSCTGPMKGLRKPSQECFDAVISYIGRPAEDIIFVDDRLVNVEAARAAGMRAVHFRGAAHLEEELKGWGVTL